MELKMDSVLDHEFSPNSPPRGHYSDLGPKGAQKEPKGTKREPEGAKKRQKGTKKAPKRSQKGMKIITKIIKIKIQIVLTVWCFLLVVCLKLFQFI